MKGTEVIQAALKGAGGLVDWYLSDLSDADILVRPVPAANHIAWQLGHLIVGEIALLKDQIPGATYPELPAGFKEKYTADASKENPPTGYLTKGEYVTMFNRGREATLANLARLSDADL